MYGQNTVYPCNKMLLRNTNSELLILHYKWNKKHHDKRSQSQKIINRMIPCIWNIYRNGEYSNSFLETEVGRGWLLWPVHSLGKTLLALQSFILYSEVRWALGSITVNKASGGDEFQLSYFKSWKMLLLKCCTQYAGKSGKLSSGHRTGKGQFSFQSQRKAMPKNAQITTQLHSSHTLVK